MKRFGLWTALALAVSLNVACEGHDMGEPEPAPPNLPQTIDTRLDRDEFDAYRELLGQAGLDDLRGRSQVTVFAPDNAAIAALPPGCITVWQRDGRIRELLAHHVVLGAVALDRAALVETAGFDDNTLPMETRDTVVLEGDAQGLWVDQREVGDQIGAINGVIHPITGGVLLTEALAASIQGGCRD